MARSSARDIIDPYAPAYTTQQMPSNPLTHQTSQQDNACRDIRNLTDAAEPCDHRRSCAGLRISGHAHDARCLVPNTPAPCYSKDANSSWTEAYVSHMSGHAQNAREIHRIEIRRIPGHSKSAENVSRAAPAPVALRHSDTAAASPAWHPTVCEHSHLRAVPARTSHATNQLTQRSAARSLQGRSRPYGSS